jgi:hypothetical protein
MIFLAVGARMTCNCGCTIAQSMRNVLATRAIGPRILFSPKKRLRSTAIGDLPGDNSNPFLQSQRLEPVLHFLEMKIERA